MGYVTLTTPIWGDFMVCHVIPMLIVMTNISKFEDSSFTLSKDMKEDQSAKIEVI